MAAILTDKGNEIMSEPVTYQTGGLTVEEVEDFKFVYCIRHY